MKKSGPGDGKIFTHRLQLVYEIAIRDISTRKGGGDQRDQSSTGLVNGIGFGGRGLSCLLLSFYSHPRLDNFEKSSRSQ